MQQYSILNWVLTCEDGEEGEGDVGDEVADTAHLLRVPSHVLEHEVGPPVHGVLTN